jgi:hypothetical protein
MIRAFQMIFSPEGVWPKIAEKNRHLVFVLFLSTLPLILGSLALEGYGIDRLGVATADFSRVTKGRELIYKYLAAHLIGDLFVVFFGSYVLLSIAKSFNGNPTYSQAFTTMAIGASPIFLMHAPDGIPALPTWVCWGIGFALAVRALYHGVAVNMRPEQTKGFGLYLVGIFILGILSALAHFIAIAILQGKMLR